MEQSDSDIVVQMMGINIKFPGVKALDNVNFTLRKNEIHSIMGENGAGKSTLIKVLTGVYKKDSGTILLNGKEFNPVSPLEARECGVNSVYQEINLCDNLSVAENIYAGRQQTRFGRINWKAVNDGAKEAIKKLNLDIDVTRLLGNYPVAIKQMVAIARAVDMNSKVLILDEPTSSLDAPEVEQLFAIMRNLKFSGLSIVFISHFLDQVYEIGDKVTVLRNGRFICEKVLKDFPRYELVSSMVGKDFSSLEKRSKNSTNKSENEILVEAKNLGKKLAVEPFGLTIRKGETVGFAGLLGSGRTEAANLFFGIDEADSGELIFKKIKRNFKVPRDAITALIAFCPEDRKKNGLIYDLSVRENIILAMQAKEGIFKFLSVAKQEEIAAKYIKMLGISTPGPDVPVGTLSGGNQQKVILARWLFTNPELLILDEPTRGIDVLAKAEIMNLAMKLCDEGMSLIFISSELEEVIRCSDRIVIMRDRKKIAEMAGADLNEEKILKTIAADTSAA
ncbi:MAG: sugar ABC transporter ATP-binding protein [Treponema sp.]|jgi:simple sugar transport system ATP-binding protein|nr:sugar ABC transporter ATP-binding protein [Treponema sp.]